MTPEIDQNLSTNFCLVLTLSSSFPTIGWMWWWCDKRSKNKIPMQTQWCSWVYEVHQWTFTFHWSFFKFIHHLHFSSIVNEHIINASNNVSHSNYQYIMVLLPPSPYVVHWDIFDQVVWIIFEDWIYVTNVAKYVMQWL